MKLETAIKGFNECLVVPYIGTWIETFTGYAEDGYPIVVPYIGTWIETSRKIGRR